MPTTLRDRTNQLMPLNENQLPNGANAKNIYENTYRGRLTEEHGFGRDPLELSEQLKRQRTTQFSSRYNAAELFRACVNNQPRNFQNAIIYFINLTTTLADQL